MKTCGGEIHADKNPLCLMTCVVLSAAALAEQGIEHSKGSPAPGARKGEILVRGTFSLEPGWFLVDDTVSVLAWEDGLVVTEAVIGAGKGEFVGVVSGLKSGAVHNVLVEMTITNGCEAYTIVATPAKAKAK